MNNFGFPFNKWEYTDLSNIHTTSAIQFNIKSLDILKIQLAILYSGKLRRLTKNTLKYHKVI